MPYSARPVPDPLPQFVGTASVRQTREQREALLSLVEMGYRRWEVAPRARGPDR